MKNYGFIGVGSMGTMLIKQFAESKAIESQCMIASNRTPEKVRSLAEKVGFQMAATNQDVAKQSDVIFLCVKPLEVRGALQELGDVITPEKLLVSIAAGVTLDNLHSWSNARIIKVIPSITSECRKGVSLISCGQRAQKEDKDHVHSLFSSISKPIEIDEKNFELFADLTSCAPAFIASIMKEFANAALRKADFPKEVAEFLVQETLSGTAELLSQKEMKFDELVTRVATKGGITEEGVKVVQRQCPQLFDELLQVTIAKHDRLKEMIKNGFASPQHGLKDDVGGKDNPPTIPPRV